jgi:hypothetical protein
LARVSVGLKSMLWVCGIILPKEKRRKKRNEGKRETKEKEKRRKKRNEGKRETKEKEKRRKKYTILSL